MKLCEPRCGKRGDHRLGFGHCVVCGEIFPWIWTEVITAKDDFHAATACFLRNRLDEGSEIVRSHTGISAVLIDLVAGGLDQGRTI